jgi:transcriptional regulator with XRE-family HTH domain
MRTFSKKNEYGTRLRNERVRLGYTQAEWAKGCGVSKTSQVSYEAGTYKPDVAYLSGAVGLGADPLYLLAGRSMAASAAAEFDWDLAEEIMTIIDIWAAGRPEVMPTAKRMRLLKLFYAQFSVAGKIDAGDLKKSLAMVG